jgi:GNAT superfamily N-acetyltransferase
MRLVGSVHDVMIRDARPDERAAVGELRLSAYRALGLLSDVDGYAETLRRFGFDGDCTVLVAVDHPDDGILGTITLEPYDQASELARDDTEADIRAFAVAPRAQGKGVGRKLLLAVIERAEKRGCAGCGCAPSRPWRRRGTSTRPPGSRGRRNLTSLRQRTSPCGRTS